MRCKDTGVDTIAAVHSLPKRWNFLARACLLLLSIVTLPGPGYFARALPERTGSESEPADACPENKTNVVLRSSNITPDL